MTHAPARPRWLSLPLSVQILALLLGGLVIAQIVTLALTLLLPPAPPQQHSLAEIAQALRGADAAKADGRPLVRTLEAGPPSLQSPGWLVSQRSTGELAQLLGVGEADVRLLFYAPPPLAGAAPPRAGGAPSPSAAFERPPGLVMASFVLAQAGPPPGGGPGGPGGFPGGPGGGGFPPPAAGPGGYYPPPPTSAPDRRPAPERRTEAGRAPTREGPGAGDRPPRPMSQAPGSQAPGGQAPPGGPGAGAPPPRTGPRTPLDAAIFLPKADPDRVGTPAAAPTSLAAQPSPEAPPALAVRAPSPEPAGALIGPPLAVAAPAERQEVLAAAEAARPLAAPTRRTLFGLTPAAYVEGEFVAALRTGPDRWVTVRPQPEGFPNSWQRRVLLWFAASFLLVAPAGYLFSRRLAAPLRNFAAAAETLGRDPSAPVFAQDGPAEVGRAARAFNLMQGRLKRYVEDRTGMIRAISHDLRTPLARMRFRLERAPPELRQGMERDLAQMEEMITSVLTFMREEASGGARQRVDLRSILECVVDDAEAGGGEISLEPGAPAEVEVDVLGVQRVFENLVDNALKYGERAKVRLFLHEGEAVTEIVDEGPGLAADELEQVFKPFYRTPKARASSKGGMGLGLAVSRATIVAHGGLVTLAPAPGGLAAEVRLPLARQSSLAA